MKQETKDSIETVASYALAGSVAVALVLLSIAFLILIVRTTGAAAMADVAG